MKWHKELNYIDGFCGPGRYKKGESGSPLVALEVARPVAHQLEKVNFLFTDEDKDRIHHLKIELSKIDIPPTYKVSARNEQFADRMTKILDDVDSRRGGKLQPSFVFIDPFGFAGVPYSLVKRILEKPRCETLITFMVDSVNRFLNHPEEDLRRHMDEIFGTSACFQIKGDDRIPRLRDLYQQQLQKAASFVRFFEMRNQQGRLIYLLFFASNNRLGHIKMKEAMWSVDPLGEFRFSDRTSSQEILFQPDQAELLWPLIHDRFRSQTVAVATVQEFVEDETAFLAKHMKAALLANESIFIPEADRIVVAALKLDGKPRLRGKFPEGAMITFPN